MVIFGNKTVTLYNRIYNEELDTETWIATLLQNVHISITAGANIVKKGMDNADKAKMYLDNSATPKRYTNPKEYASATSRTSIYTFQEGIDFFVEGDTTNLSVVDGDLKEYILQNFDNAFVVTTVDRYTDVMPHIEVGGK